MAGSDGWMYQGRQYHQWFGHGTKPRDDDPPIDGPTLEQRIRGLAATALASLPQSKRTHRAALFDAADTERLVTAMRGWVAGLGLSKQEFATRLLGLSDSHPAVDHFRTAAREIAGAITSADRRAANDALAAGMTAIGLDYWKQYLGEVATRAQDAEGLAPADFFGERVSASTGGLTAGSSGGAGSAVTTPAAEGQGAATEPHIMTAMLLRSTAVTAQSDLAAYSDRSAGKPLLLDDGSMLYDRSGKPILVPPGIDIRKNIEYARSLAGPSVSETRRQTDLFLKFFPGQVMDYQRRFGRRIPWPFTFLSEINTAYIAIGNVNFGAMMAAAGYSYDEALGFAGDFNFGRDHGGPHGTNSLTVGYIKEGWDSVNNGRLGGRTPHGNGH